MEIGEFSLTELLEKALWKIAILSSAGYRIIFGLGPYVEGPPRALVQKAPNGFMTTGPLTPQSAPVYNAGNDESIPLRIRISDHYNLLYVGSE